MKKAIFILVIGLFWCSVGFADSPLEDDDYDSRSLNNNLTKHGWKIDSVKQVSIYKEPYDIYILKKKGWISGKVKKLKAKILPHIGWNNIKIKRSPLLFANLCDSKDFYFVNSYVFEADNEEHVICEFVDFKKTITKIVKKNNLNKKF